MMGDLYCLNYTYSGAATTLSPLRKLFPPQRAHNHRGENYFRRSDYMIAAAKMIFAAAAATKFC